MTTSTKCRAKDPATCYVHGLGVQMDAALAAGSVDNYLALKAQSAAMAAAARPSFESIMQAIDEDQKAEKKARKKAKKNPRKTSGDDTPDFAVNTNEIFASWNY